MNRRMLLSQGLALGATSTVFSMFTRPLLSQVTFGRVAVSSTGAPAINESLLVLAQSKAESFLSKQRASKSQLGALAVSDGDLQSILTSAKALFSNLDESGWNSWFTQQVGAQEASILEANVAPYVTALLQQLQSQGITPTSDQIQDFYSAIADPLQSTLDSVIGNGVGPMEAQIVEALSSFAGSQANLATGTGLQPYNRATYERFAVWCDGFALGAALLGAEPVAIYFGTLGFGIGALVSGGFFD